MGKFFNARIMNMPSSEVRKLKRNTRVSVNRIYGQTKGFLEDLRKGYNAEEKEDKVSPERQKVLDRMEKVRAARKNG